MKKSLQQRIAPHALAIGIFLAVSCLYNLPAFKGMVVNQYDMLSVKGMTHQSIEFKAKYGHLPLWTNSLFSGMPAYQVAMSTKYNINLYWLHHLFTFFLPAPASLFFLCCICFYILCMVLRLRPWVGIFGALAYSFASYDPILYATGHVTKFATIGYAPAVLAGLILLTQRKYFLGFATTLLFTTLLVFQNHIQVVYYTFLTVGCMAVVYAVHAIRQREIRHLLISAGLAAAALAIGLLSFAAMLLPMKEYAKETMRGGRSELTINQSKDNKSKGGLDKDYAFNWSYGIGETATLILPNARGGNNSVDQLGDNSHSLQALQEAGLPAQVVDYFYRNLSPYWGDQPSTSGPVYFGAIVCLLFIAGLFFVRNWHLGWIVAATAVGLILAWGSNLSSINYFLFDHLPYYNKFRAPSMALVIPQLTFPLLACLAMQAIFYEKWDKAVLRKKLKGAGMVAGVVVLWLAFMYTSADFRNATDSRLRDGFTSALTRMMSQGKQPTDQMTQQANMTAGSIFTGLVKDRKAMYGTDLTRTILFLLLGAAVVWLAAEQKFKAQYAVIALVALNLFDLLPVDQRYLNNDNYVSEEDFNAFFLPNQADEQLMQDTGYYRVFDQASGSPFQGPQGARESYYKNSVGGYHPAKLALYDDLIKNQLEKYNMKVYDMLNTKYFIVNGQDGKPMAQRNPDALGPCWLVRDIRYVPNADSEMEALNTFEPADTAIVDKRERSKIPFPPQYDSSASIQLVQNLNDEISYRFKAPTNQFAVFSEIYYPEGWKAYIDGKEAPIARVDYVLRGLAIPAGTHTIHFEFKPASYDRANLISLVIGIFSIIAILFCGWMAYKKNEFETDADAAGKDA